MLRKPLYFLSLLSVFALLASCGTTNDESSGKYYENDGPPTDGGIWKKEVKDPVPKVEAPVNSANRPYKVLGKTYYPQSGDKPLVQTGYGSWYGKQFHGKKTSIGEIYDMYKMSAAHTTMELPSYAKVTNLENGKSVIVRVNDRGPFLKGRIIDLSYAAAHKLGYVNKGTAKLKVERITRKQIAAGDFKIPQNLAASKTPTIKANGVVPAVLAAVPGIKVAAAQTIEKPAEPVKAAVPAPAAKPVTTSPIVASETAGSKYIKTPEIVSRQESSEVSVVFRPVRQQKRFASPPDLEPSPQAKEAGRKFIKEGVFTVADGGASVEKARVEMAPTQAAGNKYAVQLGFFRSKANAERMLKKARKEIDPQLSSTARIVEKNGFYKVLIGRDYLPDQAAGLAQQIKTRLRTDVLVVKE